MLVSDDQILKICDLVDVGSKGSFESNINFSTDALFLNLLQKPHDFMNISMIISVLFRTNLSSSIIFVIQCCMTRTASSKMLLFCSSSSKATTSLFNILFNITHMFCKVGMSSERPKGSMVFSNSALSVYSCIYESLSFEIIE